MENLLLIVGFLLAIRSVPTGIFIFNLLLSTLVGLLLPLKLSQRMSPMQREVFLEEALMDILGSIFLKVDWGLRMRGLGLEKLNEFLGLLGGLNFLGDFAREIGES